MPTEQEMIEQINGLTIRVVALENGQTAHMAQTSAIKSDTEEMLGTFRALQGFWKTLEFIGKLAKPLAAISAFFAAWHIFIKK